MSLLSGFTAFLVWWLVPKTKLLAPLLLAQPSPSEELGQRNRSYQSPFNPRSQLKLAKGGPEVHY